jgi:uncharacterized protein YqiB (DUF1249 family)
MSAILVQRASERPAQLFEDLYGLLALLFPEFRCGLLKNDGRTKLGVSLLEHSRYTTTLALSRGFGEPLVPDLAMTVRAYHDARVAEVVAYQGCDRLPPPYIIQGDNRYVRDERRQINRLLRQLLWRRVADAALSLYSPTPDEV